MDIRIQSSIKYLYKQEDNLNNLGFEVNSKQVIASSYITDKITVQTLQTWITENTNPLHLLTNDNSENRNNIPDSITLTPSQKLFNDLVVQTANYLGNLFTVEKNKLADKSAKTILDVSGLTPIFENIVPDDTPDCANQCYQNYCYNAPPCGP